MADAKKCDRCKKYYDGNTAFLTQNDCALTKVEFQGGWQGRSRFQSYDLCDECIADLLNFIFNNYQVLPCSEYACSCLSKVKVPDIPILKMNKTSDGAQ